jgi:hypothetical protein
VKKGGRVGVADKGLRALDEAEVVAGFEALDEEDDWLDTARLLEARCFLKGVKVLRNQQSIRYNRAKQI